MTLTGGSRSMRACLTFEGLLTHCLTLWGDEVTPYRGTVLPKTGIFTSPEAISSAFRTDILGEGGE